MLKVAGLATRLLRYMIHVIEYSSSCTLLQGDVLLLDCNYTTTNRDGVVLVCIQEFCSKFLSKVLLPEEILRHSEWVGVECMELV